MRLFTVLMAGLVTAGLLCPGCATTSDRAAKPTLQNAASAAWSLRSSKDEMIVAVSSARQTGQLFGTAGTVVGAGISAATDAKHKKKILEVLGDYDAGEVFEARLAERLIVAVDNKLIRVDPLSFTPGYRKKPIAVDARHSALARRGHDLLLDLEMIYGIYGTQGTLVVKIDGSIVPLPRGEELWGKTIVVTAAPVLAGTKLSDPTKRMMPNFSLTFTDEDAIAQWTEDGGVTLKRRFEAAIDGAVSALLVDLELADEALGAYYLGKQALQQKKFDEAAELLSKAVAADETLLGARAELAVTRAHQENVDGAIEMTRALAAAHPDYGPAQYNLAWWLAVEKNDAAAARPHYEKALALGMPGAKKIVDVLEQ